MNLIRRLPHKLLRLLLRMHWPRILLPQMLLSRALKVHRRLRPSHH
jgi:hypothetical protein